MTALVGLKGPTAALLLALLLGAQLAAGYYLPGTFPQAFEVGAQLSAEVNSVLSYEDELSYDYYSLPFCKPPGGVRKSGHNVNIGTLLTGQKIQNSPYNFTLMTEQKDVEVCSQGYYGPMSAEEVKTLSDRIKENYRVRLILDNLPITTQDLEEEETVRTGYELGFESHGDFFINNHLIFTILVHPVSGMYSDGSTFDASASFELDGRRRLLQDSKYYTVVGFEVRACSANHAPHNPVGVNMVCMDQRDPETENVATAQAMKISVGARIPYTYDVIWKESQTKWASRWDAYLKMPRGQVHWFSLVNSIVVVVVLSGVVMVILLRTVRRDLVKYEEIMGDAEADFKEEFGWKLVMGDVFRPPPRALHLCVEVGTGVQILLCLLVTLIFAALGFLSPASRGALLSTCIGMYIMCSFVAGYTAVWCHGMISQSHSRWATVAMRTTVYFPGVALLTITFLNLLLRHTGSSGAIPLRAYFMIIALWGLVSIPLGLVGGYIASKQSVPQYPVRTNQIPRQIPPQRIPSIIFFLGSGLLVFGNIFIVLYFTMSSMWQGYFYYLFGFVLIAGLLTCIITAQVSVVATYLQLCTEDYRWWWNSFIRGGSVGAYVAVYAVSFLVSTLHNLHGGLSVMVYLVYMGLLSFAIYLCMGTVGFLASFYFTYKIFASVKCD